MIDYTSRFRDFLSTERNYSEHTVRAYMTDLLKFSGFLIEKEILNDGADISCVDEVSIRAYIGWLYGKKNSRKSISRKLASIRTFFEFLMREGIVRKNSAKLVPT